MRTARKYVDISALPEVSRLADEVLDTQVPHILRRGNKDVAVLVPLKRRGLRRRSSESDQEAFLASAGGWKDVDTDRLVADIYEHRRMSVRPPLDL